MKFITKENMVKILRDTPVTFHERIEGTCLCRDLKVLRDFRLEILRLHYDRQSLSAYIIHGFVFDWRKRIGELSVSFSTM